MTSTPASPPITSNNICTGPWPPFRLGGSVGGGGGGGTEGGSIDDEDVFSGSVYARNYSVISKLIEPHTYHIIARIN